MKIGIIGAGHIGSQLARRLTAVGHDVAIANSRGPQTLAELTAQTGAKAVEAAHAADGAEILVVTIPLKAVPDLPKGFLDGAAPSLAVIDTGNYYPQRDGRIAEIEDGVTESRWVERQIGHPVVKAFNNIYAHLITEQATAPGAEGRKALPVAGDGAAKERVRALVDEIGFDTVDAGGLDDSWRQQPGTPVYGFSGDVVSVRAALDEAPRERPADFRA